MLCAKFVWICFGGIENKYFKFDQCIFVISLSSPLGKSRGPSIDQNGTEGFAWIHFLHKVADFMHLSFVRSSKNIFSGDSTSLFFYIKMNKCLYWNFP